jgi:hypothetical protein
MDQRHNGGVMHPMMFSGDELKVLRQLLDLAVRQGGAAAAPAVTLFLQRIEAAERMPLPQPAARPDPESESHGPHFPRAVG